MPYRVEAISKESPSILASLIEPHHALTLAACRWVPRCALQKGAAIGAIRLVAPNYAECPLDDSIGQIQSLFVAVRESNDDEAERAAGGVQGVVWVLMVVDDRYSISNGEAFAVGVLRKDVVEQSSQAESAFVDSRVGKPLGKPVALSILSAGEFVDLILAEIAGLFVDTFDEPQDGFRRGHVGRDAVQGSTCMHAEKCRTFMTTPRER